MQQKTHAWGIASLIIGIVSILAVLAPYFGLPLAILSLVFYGKQNKIESTGIATGGLITGIIGIVVNSLMLIFVVLAMLFVSSLQGMF